MCHVHLLCFWHCVGALNWGSHSLLTGAFALLPSPFVPKRKLSPREDN